MEKEEREPESRSLASVFSDETKDVFGFNDFPFVSKLSFAPLINHWKTYASSPKLEKAAVAQAIIRELDKVQEFLSPIEDMQLLTKHKKLVDLLMSGLFPMLRYEKDLGRASAPFTMEGFYHTPAVEKLMRENKLRFCLDKPGPLLFAGAVIKACSFILNRYYGQSLRVEEPYIFTSHGGEDGVDQFYKTEFNFDFIDVKKVKPLKVLTQDQINSLFSNVYDIDIWLSHIPPENFEFHGVAAARLVNITEEETLSRLKHVLLEREAIVDRENIHVLERYLQSYFGIAGLRLGITAIDYPLSNKVAHRYKIRHDFLADQFDALLASDHSGSVYERACQMGEVLIIEDLSKVSQKTALEQALLSQGLRSMVIAPLKNQDGRIVGLLEVGSSKAYELNSLAALKFQEVIPLFDTALQRSRDEIDNQIEGIIREQYTAIHPTVDWKFIEKAFDLLEKREEVGSMARVEPIVFEDVYPLYGQADIVGSSSRRNDAIQADLVDNLQQARKVLEAILSSVEYPITRLFLGQLNRELTGLSSGINSNDEHRIIDYIKGKLHPLFKHAATLNEEIRKTVHHYFQYLDPELKVVYRQRKSYEQSVTLLNDAVAAYLEEEERKAQRVLPHYFERYKTDGVEYDIYIGQSMLKEGSFEPVHLQNLRLWQLETMCGITRVVDGLRPSLPVPLRTAQLILVHSSPLSIRFRMDEKQFDVDGAYNIRYAIIKKRIDKALIQGTGERLTVDGKVAIVYSDERDRQEYLEYIEQLKALMLIEEEVEDLLLEPAQGVQGLRALRVKVRLDRAKDRRPLRNGIGKDKAIQKKT
jgi:hypothetical protein